MALKVNQERARAKWDELKSQLKDQLITKAEFDKRWKSFISGVGETEKGIPRVWPKNFKKFEPKEKITPKKEPTQADRNKARKETEEELGIKRGIKKKAKKALKDHFDFDPEK